MGDTVTLDLLNDVIDIKAHIIQAIPCSDDYYDVMDPRQMPDQKIVEMNNLKGYEKFWIPPGCCVLESGPSSSSKVLSLLDKYGYFVGTDDDIKNDNPLISDQLQQQIGGYASTELRAIIREYTSKNLSIKAAA